MFGCVFHVRYTAINLIIIEYYYFLYKLPPIFCVYLLFSNLEHKECRFVLKSLLNFLALLHNAAVEIRMEYISPYFFVTIYALQYFDIFGNK